MTMKVGNFISKLIEFDARNMSATTIAVLTFQGKQVMLDVLDVQISKLGNIIIYIGDEDEKRQVNPNGEVNR